MRLKGIQNQVIIEVHDDGLMAIPNLIALVALNGVVAKETKDYLDRIKKKEID